MNTLKIFLKNETTFEVPESFNESDYRLVVDVTLIDEVFNDSTDDILEKVYKTAQNTNETGWVARFTGMKTPERSLSTGDVIQLKDKFYVVDFFGFTEIR